MSNAGVIIAAIIATAADDALAVPIRRLANRPEEKFAVSGLGVNRPSVRPWPTSALVTVQRLAGSSYWGS
jgi:hypothetical protein